jgi:hypothetical protein
MEEEKKKRPGRPRKKPLKKVLGRNGISQSPLNPDHCVEVVYDIPLNFKRIFTLFKSMATKNICISFRVASFEITATDHLKKSFIKVIINCLKLNHYYCSEDIKCHLNSKNIEKIIQVIDKNYNSIAFVVKRSTSRSSLSIIYKNEIKIDEIREIDLIQSDASDIPVSFDDTDYPVKFVLPSKYFKKIITDIGSFSDILTISKVGLSQLTLSYTSKDKTIKSRHIVQSPGLINLLSNVPESDIFSSSVQIEYIKPLSNSLVSDNILVSASSTKNMIFKLSIDNDTIQLMVNTVTIRLNDLV